MKRLLPLLALALPTTAHADPNAPLIFQMQPSQYHAYQNDPPPPLTLTLTLKNPTAQAVSLKCLASGGPVLKRFTQVQKGREFVGRDRALGELKPQGNAPLCQRVGQVITVPAGATYTYTRALGMPQAGAQPVYRSGWNVSLRPGFGWLQQAVTFVVVSAEERPLPTPHPEAYLAALGASHASSNGVGRGTGRLSISLTDELSRQALLAELKKRGLDPAQIEIEVARPVQFPQKPDFAHSAEVTVQKTTQGYTFTLKVTNRSSRPVEGKAYSVCEPLAVERVSDEQRVWQFGNGGCPSVGVASHLLQPGQSTTRGATWDGKDSLGQRVPPGQYRVKMGLGQFVGEAVFRMK